MFSLDMICHCPTCVAFQSRKNPREATQCPVSLSAPSIAGCAPIRGLFLHCPRSVPVKCLVLDHTLALGDLCRNPNRSPHQNLQNHTREPPRNPKISRTIRNQWRWRHQNRNHSEPSRKPHRNPQPELAPEPPEHPEPARNSHQELHRTFGLRP